MADGGANGAHPVRRLFRCGKRRCSAPGPLSPCRPPAGKTGGFMIAGTPEKSSPVLQFIARRFIGLDDRQMALLPPDRWVFSNLRGALNATPGAGERFGRIGASVTMTGILALAAAAVMATAGMAALPLAGAALAGCAAAAWRVHKTFIDFKKTALPGIGKEMGKRFLRYQGEAVRDKWRQNLEKARAQRQAQPTTLPGKGGLSEAFTQGPAQHDAATPDMPPPSPRPPAQS